MIALNNRRRTGLSPVGGSRATLTSRGRTIRTNQSEARSFRPKAAQITTSPAKTVKLTQPPTTRTNKSLLSKRIARFVLNRNRDTNEPFPRPMFAVSYAGKLVALYSVQLRRLEQIGTTCLLKAVTPKKGTTAKTKTSSDALPSNVTN